MTKPRKSVYGWQLCRHALVFVCPAVVAFAASGGLSPLSARGQPVVEKFEWLTDIPPTQPVGGAPRGPFPVRINSSGDIVGNYSLFSPSRSRGFAYVDGVFVPVPLDINSHTLLTAINDQQQIVGNHTPLPCESSFCGAGFVWDLASGITFFHEPGHAELETAFADINNEGTIAGRRLTPTGATSFREPGGDIVTNDEVRGNLAINDLGHVAGAAGFGTPSLWIDTGSGPQHVASLGVTTAGPDEINNRGQVVGSFGDGQNVHAFLFDGSLQVLPLPDGYVNADARGIDEEGRVVGRARSQSPLPAAPILWEAGEAYNLNDLVGAEVGGGVLFQAFDISDHRGWIVGTGLLNGDELVWRAKLQSPNEFRWTDPDGGDWGEGSNWDIGSAPGDRDDAIVGVDGTYVIGVLESVEVGSLIVTPQDDFGAVAATLRSGFAEVTVDQLRIGTNTPGELLMQDASLTVEGITLNATQGAVVGDMALGAAELTLASGSSVIVDGSLEVGRLASHGTVRVETGALLESGSVAIGVGPGDPAGTLSRVEVRGAANVHGRVAVGILSSAVLQVIDGGEVVVNDGDGTYVDRDSTLLVEFEGSTMTSELAPLSVIDGQAVFFNGGRGKFSAGFVDDQEEEDALFESLDVWTGQLEFTGDLTVGVTRGGGVHVQEGGHLRAQNLFIGSDSVPLSGSSTVRVGGADSEVFITNSIVIGYTDPFGFNNSGHLIINQGADVSVAGTGITVAQGTLIVASAETQLANVAGTLKVEDGTALFLSGARGVFGDVVVQGATDTGLPEPTAVTVRIIQQVYGSEDLAMFLFSRAGSALGIFDVAIDADSVVVGGEHAGVVAMVNGTLNVNLATGEVRVERHGYIAGTGAINGRVNNAAGFVSPGLSPGILTFESYQQGPGAVLEMEIGGLAAGTQYDVLQVLGDADVAGLVVLKFIDGFAPQQGQQFEFLTVGGMADLSGATFEIQNLAPGFLFDVTSSAGGATLTALNDGRFVPEPRGVLLAVFAWAGATFGYRRRGAQRTRGVAEA